MKSTLVSIFFVAAVCSTVFVSSVAAGGRDREGSTSINGTQVNSSTGRSSLGEPVFLIPSTGGNHPDRKLGGSTSSTNQSTPGKFVPASGADRREHMFFIPPPGGPPKVAQLPQVSGTGNIAGANLADHPFQGSLLNIGLNSRPTPKISKPTPDAPVVLSTTSDFLPSIVPVGPGPQGPPTLDRISTASTLPMFRGASSSGSPGGG